MSLSPAQSLYIVDYPGGNATLSLSTCGPETDFDTMLILLSAVGDSFLDLFDSFTEALGLSVGSCGYLGQAAELQNSTLEAGRYLVGITGNIIAALFGSNFPLDGNYRFTYTCTLISRFNSMKSRAHVTLPAHTHAPC